MISLLFTIGGIMKKGIFGFGLLVFLVICCSQEALANVTLNVNAKSSTLANKFYYFDGTTTKTVTLPWKEKAVYGNDGEVTITVKNALVGDLIIKVDIVSNTAGKMIVSSAWLKYGTTTGPFGSTTKVIEVIADGGSPTGGDAIDKTDLTTLCLEKQLAANTTITLFDFFTKFSSPSHFIITAILVDNVDPLVTPTLDPQVMGVDVQTVFFNYIDTTVVTSGSEWYNVTPIWIDLIQADEN
jgi:hypothetical protein